MARGHIATEYMEDEKKRLKCFNKRRLGILKKCMQISIISGCKVELKIVNDQDSSYLSYCSGNTGFERPAESFEQYAKFTNDDYELCEKIEKKVSKNGHIVNEREALFAE